MNDKIERKPFRHSGPINIAAADAELGQEGTLLDFLLENIPDRIYFKDNHSRFLRVSRAMLEFFGLTEAAQIHGRSDFDFFTVEHARPAYEDEQQIMRDGQVIENKIEKETLPDGSIKWALTTKMPLRDARGRIIGTCGISKDFTEQKVLQDALAESNDMLSRQQAELEQALADLRKTNEALKDAQQQLIEAEKMQTVARLAFGVAHEVRNPLTVLSAGLEYLVGDPNITQDETATAILGEMTEAVRRADAVVGELMDSAGPARLRLEAVDVETLIDRALTNVTDEIGINRVEVRRTRGADLPPVRVDQIKMQRAICVLLSNAVDAMPEGGTLTIRTGGRMLAEEDIARDPGQRSAVRLRAGEQVVELEIEDTGSGIPPEALTRIFDPFFTTKETGVDTAAGLGLTVCRKILELHSGAIEVGNRPEGGVRAALWLKTS